MPDAEDLYATLQVHPAADPDVVQAAYKRLALRYHPDRNKSPDAAEVMKRLNHAYEVLSDPARRREYDRTRAFQGALETGGRQPGAYRQTPQAGTEGGGGDPYGGRTRTTSPGGRAYDPARPASSQPWSGRRPYSAYGGGAPPRADYGGSGHGPGASSPSSSPLADTDASARPNPLNSALWRRLSTRPMAMASLGLLLLVGGILSGLLVGGAIGSGHRNLENAGQENSGALLGLSTSTPWPTSTPVPTRRPTPTTALPPTFHPRPGGSAARCAVPASLRRAIPGGVRPP